LLALDAFDLAILDGIDALLDQLPRRLALLSGLAERHAGVVAKCEPRGLVIELEAIAPSLDAVGFDF
jgi:hypothetical protein